MNDFQKLICFLKIAFVVLFTSLILLTSCSTDGNRYSTAYPCNFTFYASYHQTSILARVLDNPGLFVWIEVKKKAGVNHLYVHPNNGDIQEDIALTTEIENRLLSETGQKCYNMRVSFLG